MHQSTAHPAIVDVNLDEFEHAVLQASAQRPMLTDFWAEWCPPCRALAPHLEQVVREFDGRVGLARIEVDEDENMRLAGRYRVRGFPTVILFEHGEERARFSGSRSRQQILAWLHEHHVS